VVPHPALYRLAVFGPLFLVELTTIALLSLTPAAVLSRVAVQTVGVMSNGFAGWALAGFAFPSTPVSFTFNGFVETSSLPRDGWLVLPALVSKSDRQDAPPGPMWVDEAIDAHGCAAGRSSCPALAV
jgi:hypothetical protein